MASSTSHSKHDRHHHHGPVDADRDYRPIGWLKIAGCIAVFFALIEVGARVLVVRASHDLSRYQTYPNKARQLSQAASPRVAFVGNSATDEGVDANQIATEWKAKGFDASTDLFVADDSWIETWENIIERYFWNADCKPDVIVINHFGPEMLVDGERIEMGRLGQAFSTYRDWPRLFANSLPGLSKQTEFVGSALSATYGYRKRIKDRVSNILVPNYKGFKTELIETANKEKNFVAGAVSTEGASDKHDQEVSKRLNSLSRLVARARTHNCQVIFVAFPMRGTAKSTVYTVSPVVEKWLADNNVITIDLRRQESLSDDQYKDEYHLNSSGKKRYSTILADELLKVLRPKPNKLAE